MAREALLILPGPRSGVLEYKGKEVAMTRNLKVLGLALCAVFMFGALSASAASAANDVITSPLSDTFFTGTQVAGTHANEFGVKAEPNAKTTCTGATYTGTFTGTSAAQIEATPSYTGCTTGGFSSPVDVTGCKFVLTGTTDPYKNTSEVSEGEKATVSLNCGDNTANTIRITAAFGCTISFSDTRPAGTKVNQNLLGVTYENEVSGGIWDVKATVTVDKIAYTATSACSFFHIPTSGNDGFLTENVTVKGYSDSAHTKQVNVTQS